VHRRPLRGGLCKTRHPRTRRWRGPHSRAGSPARQVCHFIRHCEREPPDRLPAVVGPTGRLVANHGSLFHVKRRISSARARPKPPSRSPPGPALAGRERRAALLGMWGPPGGIAADRSGRRPGCASRPDGRQLGATEARQTQAREAEPNCSGHGPIARVIARTARMVGGRSHPSPGQTRIRTPGPPVRLFHVKPTNGAVRRWPGRARARTSPRRSLVREPGGPVGSPSHRDGSACSSGVTTRGAAPRRSSSGPAGTAIARRHRPPSPRTTTAAADATLARAGTVETARSRRPRRGAVLTPTRGHLSA
jgi:hypothetical protein